MVACGVMTIIAGLLRPDDLTVALGVVLGGLLAAVSYRGIKGGIDALLGGVEHRAAGTGPRPGLAWPLVKFFTRYGILGLAAYVVLVRLRVHPVGVVAGASSLVVAAALEAIRQTRAPSRPGNPR